MVATPLQAPRLTPLAVFDKTVVKYPYSLAQHPYDRWIYYSDVD
jgi:hypothetical protein